MSEKLRPPDDLDSGQNKTPAIEFWFDFASTYSYPAAMRIGTVAAARGVTVAWRAFLLGPIFQAQGWQDSPFNIYPAKGRYMWRDLQRICNDNNFEFQQPSQFPRNGLLAARIVCAFDDAPWVADFIRRIFIANFALDLDISDPKVIATYLGELDLDPQVVIDRASAPETKAKLRERTADAQGLGIFGAPSFVSAGELFWGNEHLERALSRAME